MYLLVNTALITRNSKKLYFFLLQSFLTCPQIQKVQMHRIIVYLGYGSMVNKYCAHTLLCPNELLQVCDSHFLFIKGEKIFKVPLI